MKDFDYREVCIYLDNLPRATLNFTDEEFYYIRKAIANYLDHDLHIFFSPKFDVNMSNMFHREMLYDYSKYRLGYRARYVVHFLLCDKLGRETQPVPNEVSAAVLDVMNKISWNTVGYFHFYSNTKEDRPYFMYRLFITKIKIFKRLLEESRDRGLNMEFKFII